MLLNPNSFLRIYNSSGVALPIIPLRERNMVYPPVIFVPGESYAVYFNTDASAGSISLTDGANTYNISISSTSVVYATGTHSFGTFTIPSIPDGLYQMTISGAQSNGVEVINNVSEANQLSAIFEYSHNKKLGSLYYPYLSTGTKQKLRLRISVSDAQSDTTISGYEEVSTGQMRNLQGTIRKFITVTTMDYSREDHDAMMILSVHDTIIINGVTYIRKSDATYKSTAASDIPVSNGEFGLYDNGSTILLTC
jgi:hypothetical protein